MTPVTTEPKARLHRDGTVTFSDKPSVIVGFWLRGIDATGRPFWQFSEFDGGHRVCTRTRPELVFRLMKWKTQQ